ncbi:MAG: hypothetical protein CMH52_07965 [Myxococcales bacterium]|nr:hypothetical protein [Myxococcales bacterium]
MRRYNLICGLFLAVYMGYGSGGVRAETKTLGLGLSLGEPTGLSGKLFIDDSHAIAAGLSFSFIDDNLHLHGDYLLHFRNRLTLLEGGDWIPYVGVGGKFRIWHNKATGDDGLSIRIPLGIAVHLDIAPLDVFFEFVPGMRLLPATDADLGAALGARWYF